MYLPATCGGHAGLGDAGNKHPVNVGTHRHRAAAGVQIQRQGTIELVSSPPVIGDRCFVKRGTDRLPLDLERVAIEPEGPGRASRNDRSAQSDS